MTGTFVRGAEYFGSRGSEEPGVVSIAGHIDRVYDAVEDPGVVEGRALDPDAKRRAEPLGGSVTEQDRPDSDGLGF